MYMNGVKQSVMIFFLGGGGSNYVSFIHFSHF